MRKKLPLNAHADISSGPRGLHFGSYIVLCYLGGSSGGTISFEIN